MIHATVAFGPIQRHGRTGTRVQATTPPEEPNPPVTLRDRIQTDTTTAMRSGDALVRDTLRMASNALYNTEKAQRRPLTDDEELTVLAREVKTRRESVEAYRAGGREDLAAKEESEIAILQRYLPSALDEAAIDALVEEAIAATGAASARDLGKVMGWLAPRTRGRADGKIVAGRVAQALARTDIAGHDAGGHGVGGHDAGSR